MIVELLELLFLLLAERYDLVSWAATNAANLTNVLDEVFVYE